MNVLDAAPGVARDPAGYWVTPEAVETSYPSGGNDFCLTLEEESFWFRHRNRMITAAVRRHPPRGGPIFDVGAGNGYVAAALEKAGFPTIAIEPNRAGAANALRRLPNVICGSFPSAAFRTDAAGAIGLFDVVEHIDADRQFLQSLRPYLRPGGSLYITTPAYQWLWSGEDVISGHFRRYTLKSLGRVLHDAGFRVVYETYFFWSLPLPIFLMRTLGSKSRKAPDATFSRTRSEHALGGRALRRIAEASFAFEVRRAERGTSIPFGGSCLVVATPSPA